MIFLGKNSRNLNTAYVKLTEAVSIISRISGGFTISCLSISAVAVKLVSNSGKNRQQSENLRTICHQKWYAASMLFLCFFFNGFVNGAVRLFMGPPSK